MTQVTVRLELTVGRCGRVGLCAECDDEGDEAEAEVGASRAMELDVASDETLQASFRRSDDGDGGDGDGSRERQSYVSCALQLVTRKIKLCGTLGCLLPDRHSGLHILPMIDEPRRRVPAPSAAFEHRLPPGFSRRRSKEPQPAAAPGRSKEPQPAARVRPSGGTGGGGG